MKGNAAAKSPEEYIAGLEEPRRTDLERLHRLIRDTVPDLEPTMVFGMIGYGPYRYRYPSGREGDGARIALASQKNYISLYVSCETPTGYVAEKYQERLPKANIGKSCVRFKKLDDLDPAAVRELLLEGSSPSPYEVAP